MQQLSFSQLRVLPPNAVRLTTNQSRVTALRQQPRLQSLQRRGHGMVAASIPPGGKSQMLVSISDAYHRLVELLPDCNVAAITCIACHELFYLNTR